MPDEAPTPTPSPYRVSSERPVRTITHPQTGTSADVYLSAATLTFYAEVAGEPHSADSYAAMEIWVLARLWANAAMQWQPVIEVQSARINQNRIYQALAGYSAKRYWIAQRPGDSHWLTTPWDNHQNGQVNPRQVRAWERKRRDPDSPLTLPWAIAFSRAEEPTVFIHTYTEDLWRSLNTVVNSLDVLHGAMFDALAGHHPAAGLRQAAAVLDSERFGVTAGVTAGMAAR